MKMIKINNRRYIGSKYRMLNNILDVLKKEKIKYETAEKVDKIKTDI